MKHISVTSKEYTESSDFYNETLAHTEIYMEKDTNIFRVLLIID